MVKTVKFLRFLSILLFLGILGIVYAYLPIMVQLTEEHNELTIHKENFFYFIAAAFLIINVFTIIMINILMPVIQNRGGENAAAWFTALTVVINLYLTFLIGYIGVINNQTHIPLYAYSYLNYLGPVLLAFWIIGFFYLNVKKKETA